MIISKQKPFDEILEILSDADNVFVLGCGKCAKKLRTGGEPEVLAMRTRLSDAGKNVVGYGVKSTACTMNSWEEFLDDNDNYDEDGSKNSIKDADAILMMSCGSGLSVISCVSDIPAYPALNTTSIGGVLSDKVVSDQCVMCGQCSIDVFGGICPSTRCPKSMMNGPCGGSEDGICELGSDRECAWKNIGERLNQLHAQKGLEDIQEPKDYSKPLN